MFTRELTSPPLEACAVARANIALAKYWGKVDLERNLPAVPSLSITLDALTTKTSVRFDRSLDSDVFVLDDAAQTGRPLLRVQTMLDQVRQLSGIDLYAEVRSANAFPTAAGLASSASAFAALAAASVHAAGLGWNLPALSDLARRASASAARSVYGGFAKLPAGLPGQEVLSAQPIAGKEHWDLRVVIALTAKGPKGIGSTAGMEVTKATSPFYDAWVRWCPQAAERLEQAVLERDFEGLAHVAQQSALAMHACAMASSPSLLYFQPPTIRALQAVQHMQSEGLPVFATIDAGPHIKAVTLPAYADVIAERLRSVEGVHEVMQSALGSGVELCEAIG